MRVVRDVSGTMAPAPMDVIYNTDLAASGSTARYKGSLSKVMDYDDIDNGRFVTFGGLATIGENVFGILEEDVAASTTYLPDDTSSGDWVRKKVTPICSGTIIEAEYTRVDAAGTASTDTNITGSASGTTLTFGDGLTTNDYLIGGWIYFLTGSNADYLHYINDSASAGTATISSALANAVTATDTCLIILPPMSIKCLFDATYTGIKSEADDNLWTSPIVGLDYFIEAPGINRQKLTMDLDGLKIPNARFYHHFCIAAKNIFTAGMASS